MTQTPELEQQLVGLNNHRCQLEHDEKVFIKVQGLNEQAEKARAEVGGLEDDNTAAKEELSELEYKRVQLIKKPLMAMQETMKEVMPEGKEAIIEITEDNEVRFGILSTGTGEVVFSPHAGLSGSEQIMFDQALAFALMKSSDRVILCYEAAEIDDGGLGELIKTLSLNDKAQIIVNSCHPLPGKLTKKWNTVQL